MQRLGISLPTKASLEKFGDGQQLGSILGIAGSPKEVVVLAIGAYQHLRESSN